MKRVVIDARESGTSTGRYMDKLLENLAKLQTGLDIVVLAKSHRIEAIKKFAPDLNVQAADYREFTFAEQLGLKKRIKEFKPDLVHFGKDHQPILYRGKTVTMMHDLTTARFRNPDKHPVAFKFKQLVYRVVIRIVAKKSTAIVTGSEFVKDDIVQVTGVEPEKITVTYEAADKIVEPAEAVTGLIGKQFLMYVGRPTPHKNLDRLIDAFSKLRADHPTLYLVLAGKKDANYRRIESEARKRAVKGIYFTDFVSEGQLRWLYENCSVYVFPSLSEGFGLPGLEAMMHGAPVASSSATCLPEIYGDAARYFDPLSVDDMAKTIGEVLSDPKLQKTLTEKGKKQAKKYSWKRMAEQTLTVYKNVLSS